MGWIAIIVGITLLGILLYWLLVTTEGVFLGRRVVVWLYDLTAFRYDAIKEFSDDDDSFFIARPTLRVLGSRHNPKILDVATGTGRAMLALLADPVFDGCVVGLDASKKMLDQASDKLHELEGRDKMFMLVQQYAASLPFPEDSFDAVCCLEALEFVPSYTDALREMIRVLKPGGPLITSRRRGSQAKLFLTRYRSKADFDGMLRTVGFEDIQSRLWELDYDMVTARKPVVMKTAVTD